MEPADSIGARRGEIVVCVAARGDLESVTRCVRSIALSTGEEVPILVFGRPMDQDALRAAAGARRLACTSGGVREALAAVSPADGVFLRSDCQVAEGWLEGLRDAAHSDGRVATATPLDTGQGALSVSVPDQIGFDEAAARVRRASLHVRPRLDAPGQHCAYVRGSAAELVGPCQDLDELALRCSERGLCHVAADEVLVQTDPAAPALRSSLTSEPVRRALSSARRALHGLSVLIDGRVLSGPMNGTKLHVLELVAAVTRAATGRTVLLVPDGLQPVTLNLLRDAVPSLETLTVSEARDSGLRVDVVHRPHQVDAPADLGVLGNLGDRLVVTQQDLISYHNPSYFRSAGHWKTYQALTERTLAVADAVVFFSTHVLTEALADGLVERDRATVVHLGVDHSIAAAGADAPASPEGVEAVGASDEVMLCIGTDYRHKNRVFALEILHALRDRHGWSGWLVLAGTHMDVGSSSAEEAGLARELDLMGAVLDLGEVTESEKSWLLGRASLVLYPSLCEGFGLVPFEAAEHGVPCLWAALTAMSELLPSDEAGIVPWDATLSAENALALMREESTRERNLRAVREAAGALRWERAGRGLLEVYQATCDAPPAPAGVRERDDGVMRAGLSEDALRLVGPSGALPPELERPLLAVAMSRSLRGPVFGALKAAYELSLRWRRSLRRR